MAKSKVKAGDHEGNGVATEEAPEVRSLKGNVDIVDLSPSMVAVPVVGLSTLVMNKFSNKAADQMEKKQTGLQAEAREAKDIEACCRAACHTFPGMESLAMKPGCRYGFPAVGFRGAIIDACSFVHGITKVLTRGSIFVMGSGGSSDLVEIHSDETPQMRRDHVRNSNGVADLRYRPEFQHWGALLVIQFDASILRPQQVVNLVNRAGFSIGIGEFRPQRDGSWGRFSVATGEYAKLMPKGLRAALENFEKNGSF